MRKHIEGMRDIETSFEDPPYRTNRCLPEINLLIPEPDRPAVQRAGRTLATDSNRRQGKSERIFGCPGSLLIVPVPVKPLLETEDPAADGPCPCSVPVYDLLAERLLC
ncbi:MAG TPA: hypothetical protein VLL74_01585, partial [Methanoregula sp.]|nr:hypothetical protein [Methanoregula sp.]